MPRVEVQLSEALGDIESTFYKHKASPHPDIFCVSNDERKGSAAAGHLRAGSLLTAVKGTQTPCQ